jgi:uncharacterized protein (DUF433 family)
MKGLSSVVVSSRDILGGIPVFSGTRVPVRNLIDCLEAGDSIDLFLYDFPTVKREQVIAVLEAAKKEMLDTVPA